MDLIFSFLYIAPDFSLTSWMHPPPVFTEKAYLSAKSNFKIRSSLPFLLLPLTERSFCNDSV
jgi:hypothetical protein